MTKSELLRLQLDSIETNAEDSIQDEKVLKKELMLFYENIVKDSKNIKANPIQKKICQYFLQDMLNMNSVAEILRLITENKKNYSKYQNEISAFYSKYMPEQSRRLCKYNFLIEELENDNTFTESEKSDYYCTLYLKCGKEKEKRYYDEGLMD